MLLSCSSLLLLSLSLIFLFSFLLILVNFLLFNTHIVLNCLAFCFFCCFFVSILLFSCLPRLLSLFAFAKYLVFSSFCCCCYCYCLNGTIIYRSSVTSFACWRSNRRRNDLTNDINADERRLSCDLRQCSSVGRGERKRENGRDVRRLVNIFESN